ncbi:MULTISPECIES: cytidylyltransferase domain-containing protein [unclassified Mucilaginibacter]|uniref:cytidylyltransferase domain-containing protein n=1 Tax=unclassified Mucilaginibacter TaxID=2617802 RepID=UPI00095EF864|nr:MULTISPECIES: NTP transferase domain-containing protein [unclassified Mucilaginibacter]OJW15136.1 MAG: hypothetical protein BGO48_13390 [Mucilaginibacter sp. 44-25]PLW91135.1 MAG: acylneuraminate cytidylyltransferase [Mucilaginibacter sp.]PMP64810.1 MAG: acylneuraminate cytidylyltransferase [Mucilaginibacter sp.]HEK19147.1 acylneuraminate cytidylyltransferase [Bacteroidota bacterium]
MAAIAVIQARMGSTRLRGKSLMPLAGVPLLKRVISSVQRNAFINNVIVATSTLPEDDPIEAYCRYLDIDCVRGDSKDVLSRFVKAADGLSDTDNIIRVTADNPFNRCDVSAALYETHVTGGYDYTYVDGLSHIAYEVINVAALRKIWDSATLNEYHREHVTPYFRDNPEQFKLHCVGSDYKGLRPQTDKLLTVDSAEDHQRIEKMIIDINYDKQPDMDFNEIYQWLKLNIHQ